MRKIVVFCILFITLIIGIPNVFASSTIEARIGNKFFDHLEDAINAASSKDIIDLTTNVKLDDTLNITKTVNINLNNNNIEAEEMVFLVKGGSLNLSGKGSVIESKPNYGAIMIKGSDDSEKVDYSTVKVGSDITLKGWSGIFINHDNKKGYGILVNMNGKIEAVNDVGGSPGVGIYVNGNIQDKNNAPVINLTSTSQINSTGTGIYAAGYSTYNINGAYISGVESGIAIKSGTFNILDGTIIGTGEDKTPTIGNNDGINPTGTAIQIESNSGYSGNIKLNIKNGTIKSKNSNVLYEYTVKNNETEVKEINITGGTFISDAKKNVFLLSDSFKSINKGFISGGTYSSDPSAYLKSGYGVSVNTNSLYEVVNDIILSTFNENKNFASKSLGIISVIILSIVLFIMIYLNRKKIKIIKNI